MIRARYILKAFCLLTVLCGIVAIADAQTTPLTYKEIVTALNVKLPNAAFETKSELVKWVEEQVVKRGVSEPLTEEREKELEDAEASILLIETIRANSPPYHGFYTKKGNKLYEQGRYQDAREMYDEAIKLNSESAELYVKSALTHLKIFEVAKSKYDFAVAARLDPKLKERADMKCLMSDLDKDDSQTVFDLCDKAIKEGNKERLLYAFRGHALAALGNPYKALSDFAVADLGDTLIVAIFTAAVHAREKLYSLVIEGMGKLLVRYPNIQTAYVMRGAAYAEIGSYAKAISDFDKAIELNPSDAAFYKARGIIYAKMNLGPHALENLSKAIELDSNDSESYLYRATIRHSTGDYAGAVSDYESVLRFYANQNNQAVKLVKKNMERARKNKPPEF